MYALKPEEHEIMTKLRSAPRWIHQATPQANPDSGEVFAVKCELVDSLHDKVWAEGQGIDEEQALKDAIAGADQSRRPMSAEEVMQENVALRRRLARYESEAVPEDTTYEQPSDVPPGPVDKAPAEQVSAVAAVKENLPPEQPPAGSDLGENLEMLAPEDLVTALRARGETPPAGDRRTREWKDRAIELLKQPA